MEQSSLLSHGATAVLRDAQVVRGQRNDDYWRAFRLGMPPPSPKVPMVYGKFLSYLQGAGINVKKDGHRLQLFALTDRDIGKLSAGAITLPDSVKGDTLDEIPGGLFDRALTGGHGGNRWSHIDLAEPIPNPVMEEPIRRLLGLTGKQYEEMLAGRHEINGLSGGVGIQSALKKINLDAVIEYHRGIISDGPKSKRDNSAKVLGYLQTMKKHSLRPEDFVLSKVPVLPPAFRPVTPFKNMILTADPNYLYRDLMLANDDLKEMKGIVNDKAAGNERLRLYHSFKAVAGLGDPVQAKTEERGVRGLLAHVFGSSPKHGLFQRRVLGSPVDVVGRAVITPNPGLNMDQVGLPESKAWVIYRPFIMRRLVRAGLGAGDSARAIANEDPVARKAMLEEMKARPVLINRAPTMHRYGFMAAWPVLTKGNTLQISPVLTPGFGADFDGDAMNYHVPATDEAVQESIERMLPSKNLKSVRDFKVHYVPRNEFLMGLYLASTSDSKKPARIFRSKEDVLAAYRRGEIGLGDRVMTGS
jgi:DNA-directed RNA polymerase beta' subunit